jgi:Hydrogenase 4 membrane component (E)
MLENIPLNDILKILLVLVLVTSALVLWQRSLTSLFKTYALQSLLVALVALAFFIHDGHLTLLFIVLLTLFGKVFLIPRILNRILFQMNIRRDLEFRFLYPVSSLIVSILLVFGVYQVFSSLLGEVMPERLFTLGAVIGVSMALMGMMVIFSRKKMLTKIVGYLSMENGAIVFGLFVAELPFILEILVLIDLVILVLLLTVLAFGIDSTIEDFHPRFTPLGEWFKKK